MIKIGNTVLNNGVMLAPMAGFTDRAMRKICHLHGCEYSVTEMVSAKAVVYGDKKTYSLARIREDEGNTALQIFGSEPNVMAEGAAKLLLASKADKKPIAVDINMGCPVHKIFSNGEGSALMKNPDLIYKIVREVNRAIDIPVTVKLRAGVGRCNINAVECAIAAEEGGASLIALHGRTREEMYSGKADREIIKNVKNALHIPLVANGDITDGASAVDMLNKTGADGIMIGRGAIGNPFIFDEIAALLSGRTYSEPSAKERIEAALLQLRIAIEEKGELYAVREARKQTAMYLRAFRGAAAVRAEINRAETYNAVEKAMKNILFQAE